jgi:DNA-binding CsgD family transcriptional regulator
VRAHGPALAAARRSAHHGCQVRTAGTPFEPLIVCDRAVAFIPVPAPRGLHPRVLAIREPGLVEYFVRTFDALWERAEPLTVSGRLPRAAPKTDEVEQAVLELMVKGHTDAAISTRLGVSVRTIGTYIKRASERFDSHSRAELGYRLAKSGLFEAE